MSTEDGMCVCYFLFYLLLQLTGTQGCPTTHGQSGPDSCKIMGDDF